MTPTKRFEVDMCVLWHHVHHMYICTGRRCVLLLHASGDICTGRRCVLLLHASGGDCAGKRQKTNKSGCFVEAVTLPTHPVVKCAEFEIKSSAVCCLIYSGRPQVRTYNLGRGSMSYFVHWLSSVGLCKGLYSVPTFSCREEKLKLKLKTRVTFPYIAHDTRYVRG